LAYKASRNTTGFIPIISCNPCCHPKQKNGPLPDDSG
jgi:hypothetical protein